MKIDLEKVSVKDLFDGDEDAGSKTFGIFCNSGFFYLDLTTDERGKGFIDAASQLHDAAKDIFANVSMADKETFRGDPLRGVLDVGYRAMGKDETGQPNAKGELSSPEKKMTVEEWIRWNAKNGEERLKRECERLVGQFEREGGRAMQALEGTECID